MFGNYIGEIFLDSRLLFAILISIADQDPMADMPPEDDYDEDDEESVNLLDVSSDVEIDPAELDGLDDSDDDAKFVHYHVVSSATVKFFFFSTAGSRNSQTMNP